jgi:hypothetical protein
MMSCSSNREGSVRGSSGAVEMSLNLQAADKMPLQVVFTSIKDYEIRHGSTVGITTGYSPDDRWVTVQVPAGRRIFTSPYPPDWLWGLPNLLSNE